MVIEQVISSKYLHINNPEVSSLINEYNIECVYSKLIKDHNGESVVCLLYTTPELRGTNKRSQIVRTKRGYRIRTPHILRRFIGEKIMLYYNKIQRINNEIARIKPVNFSFDGNRAIHKKVNNFPYFTKSGYFVIPEMYINQHVHSNLNLVRMSFNRVMPVMVDHGILYGYLTVMQEYGYNFMLKQKKNGFNTAKLTSLITCVGNSGKLLSDFVYEDTYDDPAYEYGIMLFKELQKDG